MSLISPNFAVKSIIFFQILARGLFPKLLEKALSLAWSAMCDCDVSWSYSLSDQILILVMLNICMYYTSPQCAFQQKFLFKMTLALPEVENSTHPTCPCAFVNSIIYIGNRSCSMWYSTWTVSGREDFSSPACLN